MSGEPSEGSFFSSLSKGQLSVEDENKRTCKLPRAYGPINCYGGPPNSSGTHVRFPRNLPAFKKSLFAVT